MNEPFRGKLVWDRETKTFKPLDEKKKVDLHYVITDEIPETESYATDERRTFTSKKKLYEHYKENHMIVKEPGTDPLPVKPYKSDIKKVREDAEKCFYDLKYNRVPIDEKEKERCRQEERIYQEYRKRRGAH